MENGTGRDGSKKWEGKGRERKGKGKGKEGNGKREAHVFHQMCTMDQHSWMSAATGPWQYTSTHRLFNADCHYHIAIPVQHLAYSTQRWQNY